VFSQSTGAGAAERSTFCRPNAILPMGGAFLVTLPDWLCAFHAASAADGVREKL
jgi:hypothetical protein